MQTLSASGLTVVHWKKKQNRLLTNRTQFCTADLGFVDVVGGLSVLNAFLGGLKNKIKLYLNEAEMKKKQ